MIINKIRFDNTWLSSQIGYFILAWKHPPDEVKTQAAHCPCFCFPTGHVTRHSRLRCREWHPLKHYLACLVFAAKNIQDATTNGSRLTLTFGVYQHHPAIIMATYLLKLQCFFFRIIFRHTQMWKRSTGWHSAGRCPEKAHRTSFPALGGHLQKPFDAYYNVH